MPLNSPDKWGVTNLRLAFPKKKEMFFRDLTFHYRRGEKILLLGPSGCGKSTLLQVLSGLVPKSIELPMKADGVSVPENWGFIFQDPDSQFCMPYADEEIAFVLENQQVDPEKMPNLIQHYLKMVGLEFADPHRLISELSGGMKQRLAVASVLALEPEILYLDEPTALLDPEGTELLWQTVRRIGRDRTLLIVEHKIDHVLDMIDRIVLFNPEGKIIADGVKDEILQKHVKELDEYGIWYPGVWQKFEKKNHEHRGDSPKGRALLELENFSVTRQKKIKFSLSHLTISQGEWIAIIGENGAGKSTMVEGIMGLLHYQGKVRWHLDHPRDQVAFVFQNPEYQFVTDRVDDELGLSLVLKKLGSKEIDSRVNEALDQFLLEKQRSQHPFQLSVGQKRRLSVASTLIDHPKAVILDEPTFGQDARNTFALLNLFQRLRQSGATVIMITHEMEIARHFATRVLKIKDGRLVEDSCRTAERGREGEKDGGTLDKHGQTVFQD